MSGVILLTVVSNFIIKDLFYFSVRIYNVLHHNNYNMALQADPWHSSEKRFTIPKR